MKEFEILSTDMAFHDSPDAGDPLCFCSRCKKKIPSNNIVTRAWPELGDHGYDPTAKGGTEFRYCENCMESMGATFAKPDPDYEGVESKMFEGPELSQPDDND
jgi:hypothetical protein